MSSGRTGPTNPAPTGDRNARPPRWLGLLLPLALLAEVGLQGLGGRLPRQLSGGQAQRVALARALFVQPRLLLDEPFSALDAVTRLKLQALLRLVRVHRIGVLMVTHDIDEAAALGDRVLVLDAAPGCVAREIAVPAPQPRDPDAPASVAAVAAVRHALQAVHALQRVEQHTTGRVLPETGHDRTFSLKSAAKQPMRHGMPMPRSKASPWLHSP